MKRTKLWIAVPGVLVMTAIWMFACSLAYAADVPKMSSEELKGLLDNPDVIILDVRTDKDWEGSDSRITSARREAKKDFKNWADKYPKDKTLVLYCA